MYTYTYIYIYIICVCVYVAGRHIITVQLTNDKYLKHLYTTIRDKHKHHKETPNIETPSSSQGYLGGNRVIQGFPGYGFSILRIRYLVPRMFAVLLVVWRFFESREDV